MPSPILARADALMHRKRQPEAEFDDLPILTDAIDDEDDIPVLIDEAPSATEEAPLPATPLQPDSAPVAANTAVLEALAPGTSDTFAAQEEIIRAPGPTDTELREQLASELARRVEQRLAAELPRIIESTLRDFLAEQAMIAASPHRD